MGRAAPAQGSERSALREHQLREHALPIDLVRVFQIVGADRSVPLHQNRQIRLLRQVGTAVQKTPQAAESVGLRLEPAVGLQGIGRRDCAHTSQLWDTVGGDAVKHSSSTRADEGFVMLRHDDRLRIWS